MAFGILLGAWIFKNHGWPFVWVGAGLSLAISVVDAFYGAEIGAYLGKATLDLFNRGTYE